MYKEHCASNDILPQKRHLYSSIFNYEFNLGFHVPRKDMCDLCEEYKAQSSNSMVSDELEVKYNDHILYDEHGSYKKQNLYEERGGY
jgi:hypothetical protein